MYTKAQSFDWCIDLKDKTKPIISCKYCLEIDCVKSNYQKQIKDVLDLEYNQNINDKSE